MRANQTKESRIAKQLLADKKAQFNLPNGLELVNDPAKKKEQTLADRIAQDQERENALKKHLMECKAMIENRAISIRF